MKATDILYEEHRIILKVLECMEKLLVQAEEKRRLDAEAAHTAIEFFKNFADGCHHAKEEEKLFEVMQQNGVPREGGPIEIMIMEHEYGRKFVRGMSENLEQAAAGDQSALARFSENANDLIVLLSNHISKEDHVLFPMAGQILDRDEADRLLSDFKNIEAQAGGKRHAHYLQIARQLCQYYGIPFVSDAQIRTLKSEFQLQ